MDRRRAILAISCLSGAVSFPNAFAQQKPKVWRIGCLNSSTRLAYFDEFPRAMRDLGYIEGRNLVIEWRFADGQYDRLPALAADLVSKKLDVIVVASTPAMKAA